MTKSITLSAVLLLISSLAMASSWQAYFNNHKAVKSLEDADSVTALQEVQQGLSRDGVEPALHYNLGAVLEVGKDYSTAAKQYLMAAKLTSNDEEKFMSLFNAARCLGEAKQISEALSVYQKALAIKPDSIEVKTNIELLLQQQQGGGGGGSDDQKQQQPNQDQQGQGPQPQPNQQQKPKEQKRKFESRDLTEHEVRRILDELKRQEEKIREKELNKKPQKETPGGKDW